MIYYQLWSADVACLAVAAVVFVVVTAAVLSTVAAVEVLVLFVAATEVAVLESSFLDQVLVLQRFPYSTMLPKSSGNL